MKYAVRRKRPVLEDLPPLVPTLSRPLPTPRPTPRRRSPPRASSPASCRRRPCTPARPRWRCRGPTSACTTPPTSPPARCSGPRWTGVIPVKVGIVGLPNAGKSSLFNALTRAGAEAANYPFTTVEPNVAVVPGARRAPRPGGRDDRRHADGVRDDRVPRHRGPGARRPRGRGARATASWRTSARPTRSCTWSAPTATPRWCTPRAGWTRWPTSRRSRRSCCTPTSSRPSGGWSGCRARRSRSTRRWWPRSAGCARSSRRCGGPPARTVPPPADAPSAMRNLQPLTSKPVLYVANVAEGEPLEPPPELVAHAGAPGARAAAV